MMSKSRFAAWAVVAVLAVGGVATAQEAIPTATGSPTGGAPMPAPSGPIRLSDRVDTGDNILRSVSPCGAPPKANGSPDRSPHGEVFAGVGTHGYREGGGVVCVPLGDHASATLAVDAGRIDDRGRRR